MLLEIKWALSGPVIENIHWFHFKVLNANWHEST